MATDVGANSFAGKIQQVVDVATETPATYALYRGIDLSGVGFAPETARTGLGGARVANSAPETESEPESEIEPTPAPESEPAPEPEPTQEDTGETPPEPVLQTPEDSSSSTEPGNPTNSEDTSEGQVETPEGKYNDVVNKYYGVIPLDLSIALMEPPSANPNTETQRSWGKAINELSPEGKAGLKEIFEMRKNLPEEERNSLDIGKNFYNYLVLNPDVLQ